MVLLYSRRKNLGIPGHVVEKKVTLSERHITKKPEGIRDFHTGIRPLTFFLSAWIIHYEYALKCKIFWKDMIRYKG